MNLDKYYRCYANIDLDNIRKNAENLKAKLEPSTGMLGVIKTDAYGHGAVPVAKAIDDICSGFAVATAYEAHNLRTHGIDKPIFLLGYSTEYDFDVILNDDLIPCVSGIERAKVLSDYAKDAGKTVKLNVAVDTGMGRIGYEPTEDSADEIVEISKLDNIEVYSLFTHFAKADYKDKAHADSQLAKFDVFIKILKDKGLDIPIYQCANSAAIMEMPETSMSLSRAGIALYGLYPSDEMDKENIELFPAMSLYSHVIYVKDVPQGTGISYGSTYVTDEPMKIATIPVGYGDGYPRGLSNKGMVIIKGNKVPIVGRVCMDQFMVDVTGLDVEEGDLVTLMGTDGDETISADDIANEMGTINYEIVCDVGKRVPRVYIKDGKIVGSKDYYDDKYEIEV